MSIGVRLFPRFDRRESRAPHLLASLASEVVEKLDESGQAIELGEEDVHRETHAELELELVEARANRQCMLAALLLGRLDQVGKTDGDDGAVDRLPLAVLLEQLEKAGPCARVDGGVTVLRRVAAGRVDQHRLVGEPPIAGPGPAHAADLLAGSPASGKVSPELMSAVVLPEPGGPMNMYQGSS